MHGWCSGWEDHVRRHQRYDQYRQRSAKIIQFLLMFWSASPCVNYVTSSFTLKENGRVGVETEGSRSFHENVALCALLVGEFSAIV